MGNYKTIYNECKRLVENSDTVSKVKQDDNRIIETKTKNLGATKLVYREITNIKEDQSDFEFYIIETKNNDGINFDDWFNWPLNTSVNRYIKVSGYNKLNKNRILINSFIESDTPYINSPINCGLVIVYDDSDVAEEINSNGYLKRNVNANEAIVA